MHARRSLIALVAALLSTAALAHVPGLGASLAGLVRGVVYSAWNPADAGGAWSFSNNNATASESAAISSGQIARGSLSHATGKWYFEVNPTAIPTGISSGVFIGVATSSASLGNFLGKDAFGYGYSSADGLIYHSGSGATYGATYTNTATISVAIDLSANKFYVAINGTWQNSANPASGFGGYTIAAGTYFPTGSALSVSATAGTLILNTGRTAFAYAIPSGFLAWH